MNVARSLRSAPAQNDVSTVDARIRARVGPFEGSEWISSIAVRSSVRSWRDMAFRKAGRLRERILMLPQFGAGMDFI